MDNGKELIKRKHWYQEEDQTLSEFVANGGNPRNAPIEGRSSQAKYLRWHKLSKGSLKREVPELPTNPYYARKGTPNKFKGIGDSKPAMTVQEAEKARIEQTPQEWLMDSSKEANPEELANIQIILDAISGDEIAHTLIEFRKNLKIVDRMLQNACTNPKDRDNMLKQWKSYIDTKIEAINILHKDVYSQL